MTERAKLAAEELKRRGWCVDDDAEDAVCSQCCRNIKAYSRFCANCGARASFDYAATSDLVDLEAVIEAATKGQPSAEEWMREDAFERGKAEGAKQERALWTLSTEGQVDDAINDEARNPWKHAVIIKAVLSGVYRKDNENNPEKAIADVIEWHVKMALDPAVSEDARALIAKAKEEGAKQEAALWGIW